MQIQEYYADAIRKSHNVTVARIIKGIEEEPGVRDNHLTSLRRHQLEKGQITVDEAIEFAIKSFRKKAEKTLAKNLAEAQKYPEMSEDIKSIDISILWEKNRTWGYIPKVSAVVAYLSGCKETYSGTATGCGCDLRSVAVANALNDCVALRHYMACLKYKNRDKAENFCGSNESYICYGAGYGVIPPVGRWRRIFLP